MRAWLAALLALSAATAADPDSLGWVTGRVVYRATGEPLLNADVAALGTQRGTAVEDDGSFVVALPAGHHRLRATYLGFEPESADVNVTEGDTVAVNLALMPMQAWPNGMDGWGYLRRSFTRDDSIRPILATTEWDVTVCTRFFPGEPLLIDDPALADNARVRALRVWRAGGGSYSARTIRLNSRNGDTLLTNYVLVEDGRCTTVLQAPLSAWHTIEHPTGGAIAYWDGVSGWVGWNGDPLDRPGRLRLLLQVEGQPPDKPYIF